jgi:hypothetical protein
MPGTRLPCFFRPSTKAGAVSHLSTAALKHLQTEEDNSSSKYKAAALHQTTSGLSLFIMHQDVIHTACLIIAANGKHSLHR